MVETEDTGDRLRMLSLSEASDAVNLPEETLRRALKNGDLKGVMPANRIGWRVRRGDLHDFIAQLVGSSREG